MKFILFILLAGLVFGLVRTRWNARRVVSAEERGMAIRLGSAAWLLGFVFVAAFLFLPNKQRVLMLLPAFIVAVSLAKFWRDKRNRLRRESDESARLARMKRVN